MAQRRTTKNERSAKQVAFTRFMLIVAFFVLWIGGISARLVYLQVNQHDWLRERALGQRRDVKRTRIPRGTIYDRNDRVLAMSVNVKTLYANPMEIENLSDASRTISKVIGVNANKLYKQLRDAKDDGRKFVALARELDELAVEHINRSLETSDIKKNDTPKFLGLYWRDEQKRSYPNGPLAAHVVGFSNADGVGQAGIEQSQNDKLHGAVIRKLQERDRLGRVYDEIFSEQEPPKDVVLTISHSIQFKVEEALATAVRTSAARSGMAIAIDHKTGEILALANYPTFDPNKLNEITKDNLTNRVIQSVYSPGSVFKLVTYGSALEKNLITPDAMIDSGNGTIEVAKHKFRDSHGIGKVSYSKAMAHSSNVCAIKTGMRVGKNDFYSTLQKLGFGRPLGIELPAETPGIVRNPAKWNGDSLASMSIGYEIGVSALQMVSAFATIANDGVRVQPHVIKEIRHSDEIVDRGTGPEKTRVVSAETARSLRTMLREVVLDGTGRRAQLDGYSTAGKTGTAWKFDEATKRISSSKYISSFIGFAPAENPAITIGVIIDEPKIGGRDGGQVAAPVFHDIAEQVLPELGIAPDLPVEQLTASAEIVPAAAQIAPQILTSTEKLKTEAVATKALAEKPSETKSAAKASTKSESKGMTKPETKAAAKSVNEMPKRTETAPKPATLPRPTLAERPRTVVVSKGAVPAKQKPPIKNKAST